jgi:ribosomal-protein-alanine N-acetyltransferase
LGHAKAQSVTRVMLEVRKSNLAAQKLYEAFGFSTTGVRKGYYSDDGEDALAMTMEITD